MQDEEHDPSDPPRMRHGQYPQVQGQDEFPEPDRCEVAECENGDRNDGSQPQRDGWARFAVKDAEQRAAQGEQEPDDEDDNREVPDAVDGSGAECVCHDVALLSCCLGERCKVVDAAPQTCMCNYWAKKNGRVSGSPSTHSASWPLCRA